jgi:hypothetical protein
VRIFLRCRFEWSERWFILPRRRALGIWLGVRIWREGIVLLCWGVSSGGLGIVGRELGVKLLDRFPNFANYVFNIPIELTAFEISDSEAKSMRRRTAWVAILVNAVK